MTTTNENEATNANANEEREQDGDVRQEESEATGTPESVEDTAATDQQVSIEELQADLATRDERVFALEEQVISLERELSSTVSRYRLALLDASPEVPGDLVGGESAEELEASLAKAKGVVEQVRSRLLEGMESASRGTERSDDGDATGQDTEPVVGRIPAGAPARSMDDGSADLSARDKIALGLERL